MRLTWIHLNIACAAIECASISKGGGLSDVIESLLQEAAEQGDNPLLIMPYWSKNEKAGTPPGEFRIRIKNKFSVYLVFLPAVLVESAI